MVSRRWMLAGGAASGLLSATGLSAQIANAPKFPASSLRVVIDLNGQKYIYPDGPNIPSYFVDARTDGAIVFHLGTLGIQSAQNPTTQPYHLGPHRVRIEKDGSILMETDVPAHWWNARWIYRPNSVAIRRSPAQIVAANRMFPYGDTGLKMAAQQARIPYEYMGSSNVTKSMPTTGERPDIGLITDNSARFMLGQDPLPMIDWALAAESCPMHFRDEATGKPIDLFKYPGATVNPNQGPPVLAKGQDRKWGGGWTPQQAHYPELSYLAHIATLDAGFLEDLQYSATFSFVADAWLSGSRKVPTLYGEYRGIAWSFRNLFMVHAATKDAEARGALSAACHPSSYWKKLLDAQLAYYTITNMNDPSNQLFRLVTGKNRFGPWQADYMLTALAFGVLTGHTDWAPLYLWALKNAIDRTSGKSGYPVGWGGAYYLNTYPWLQKAGGTYDTAKYDTNRPFNWYESFLWLQNDKAGKPPTQEQIDVLRIDPFNGGKAMAGDGYLLNTRAVLVMAQYLHKLGLVDVKSVYPDLDLCFTNIARMVKISNSMKPRASVVIN